MQLYCLSQAREIDSLTYSAGNYRQGMSRQMQWRRRSNFERQTPRDNHPEQGMDLAGRGTQIGTVWTNAQNKTRVTTECSKAARQKCTVPLASSSTVPRSHTSFTMPLTSKLIEPTGCKAKVHRRYVCLNA